MPPAPVPAEARRDVSVPGAVQRLAYLAELVAKRHPRSRPHRYLAFVGVHLRRQGRGIGSELLVGQQAGGVAAYLEATSSRARELFLRHGYTDVGPAVLLSEGIPVWPMWREPAS